MRSVLVVFTRDLRVHDHPALAEAARQADTVVPLFVLDDRILASGFASANRVAFLGEALADLDDSLTRRGAPLVLRRGDVVHEAVDAAKEANAAAIFASADVSAYAQQRERRLEAAAAGERIGLRLFPGATVISPGELTTSAGTHYSVFTPYYRQWSQAPRRTVEQAPRRLRSPARLRSVAPLRAPAGLASERPAGGETAGRRRLTAWIRSGLTRYGDLHDDLAADATSRLSPYLHFGCISPLELVERIADEPAAEAFTRQLCWRDFYHQLLAARPDTSHANLRDRGDRWHDDSELLDAWKQGQTGYPIVDAGMRQLLREGFIHNRARLITASFLTKDLYLDWRLGARHYFDHLVDGDIANNIGNWQWVAGTGADTRPNRIFNPIRQAIRFDPRGDYVRRHVPELAELDGPRVHEPWKLGSRAPGGYPEPIVEHELAAAEFRRRRHV